MRHRLKRLIARRSPKAGLAPGTLVHIGERTREVTRTSILDFDELALRELEVHAASECRAFKDSPNTSWINVDSVHDVELLREFGQDFGLHPLVLEDIVNTDQRPKLEDYGEYLYIVVKMLSNNGGSLAVEQVSLVLGASWVLSFQERGKPGDVFDPIRVRIRSGAGKIRKRGADFLAYSLIDAIVDNYFVILERVGDRIEAIEEDLLTNPIPATLTAIHHLRREMIFLRRSVWPLREMLSTLQRGESKLVQQGTQVYLRDVYDHTIQVIDTVESLRDVLQGMLEIYLSSVNQRMTEVMKVLTVIATVFIPLTFIVGVYGMNFEYFPELKWRWGYPALWGIMVGIGVLMLIFFKRRKWI
ncbi:MAG: magnesium/cobalt transporter CorA [Gammaproteobacteria bacterium]